MLDGEPDSRRGRFNPLSLRGFDYETRTYAYLVSFFAVEVLLFGLLAHPIEAIGSAENDQYVWMAEVILGGQLPHDVYRPLLYPLSVAGTRVFGLGGFEGAQLISMLSAIVMMAATIHLAKRIVSFQAVILCAVLLVFSFPILSSAVMATTDMIFSALVLLNLCCMVEYDEARSRKWLFWMSLTFSLAFFARYTAAVLLFPLVLVFIVQLQSAPMRTFKHGLLCVSLVLVFLLPHFVLSYVQFESPLYNENWKNTAFKLYGEHDWSYFDRIPYASGWDFMSASYGLLFGEGISSLKSFATRGMPGLISTDELFRVWLYPISFLIGLIGLLLARKRSFLILLSFLAAYTVGICMMFHPWPRLMFVLLPIVFIALSYAWIDFFSAFLPNSWQKLWGTGVIGLCALVGLLSWPAEINRFVARHPLSEVDIIRKLGREKVNIMGTFLHGWRFVEGSYSYIPDAFGLERIHPELFLEKVRLQAESQEASYFVVGRLTLENRPEALLRHQDLPDWLKTSQTHDDFVVYRIELGYSVNDEADPG